MSESEQTQDNADQTEEDKGDNLEHTASPDSVRQHFVLSARCRGITQVRVETRRDRRGLELKSKRGWRKERTDYAGPRIAQGHGPSTQRTQTDADTSKRKQ